MIQAWHFVGKTLRDGRLVPKDGVWLAHKGPLVLCESGLHASRSPFDALRYAPGETLCLVECDGKIVESDDKLVCERRRIVRRMDATELLRYFARMQAVSVIHLWEVNPPGVVLDYLMTGDESLRAAAGDAAGDAVWAATRAAAGDAAGDAAWAATRAAARAAARDAVWAAAGDAAGDAVWAAATAAARDAARDDFDDLVRECFDVSQGAA